MRKCLVAYNGADAGLGNRIRVVLGSEILAERENRRLLYVWPSGPKFEPKFSDLFDFQRGIAIPRWFSRLIAKKWHYVDEKTEVWLSASKRREWLWQIRTGSEVHLPEGAPHWGDRLRELTPAPDIADRVQRIFDAELRGRRYVGVMIRAHAVSHQKTKDTSPVSWFVERMRELRAADPDVVFYLCCDVPQVQAQIAEEFGRCVVQVDKGGYNTTEGVKSAVVDLYLLACSQFLIAPHFSSFLHLARHLAKDAIPFHTPVSQPSIAFGQVPLGLAMNPLRPWERATP